MDPGTTVGLAILDLRGRLLHLSSKKGADDRWIVETVTRYGVPIIVATDVSPPPERVVKIASAFGAKLWHPGKDLSVAYKEDVARKFSYGKNRPTNDHERDALAAAFAAFSTFASKFRQIERRLRVEGRLEDEDIVKRAVVFGQSVDRALRHKQQKEREGKGQEKEKQTVVQPQPPIAAELRKRLEIQGELIEELRQEVYALRKKLRRAMSEREREIRKDALVQRLEREKEALLERLREKERRIDALEKEIQRLRKILEGIAKGKYVLLPKHQAEAKKVPILLSLNTYAVVEKAEWEKRDPEAFAERLKRMIEEYQRARADKI